LTPAQSYQRLHLVGTKRLDLDGDVVASSPQSGLGNHSRARILVEAPTESELVAETILV
jgi:hypothetical protein